MNSPFTRPMRTVFHVLAVLAGLSFAVHGQQRTWIFFDTKHTTGVSDARSLGISERALTRRAKVLSPDRIIDADDLPVSPTDLQRLRDAGATIHTVSRWLNAVSVSADSTTLQRIATFPNVVSTRSIAVTQRTIVSSPEAAVALRVGKASRTTGLDYGYSAPQVNSINAVPLHNLGVIGRGVLVGMLDDGFSYHLQHPALKGIRVVGEYDFVAKDSNTSIQPGDAAGSGYHGAATLGTLAGYDPGTLIGPAFGADLLLGRTEIDSTEIQIEEDNYVAGLEWLEQKGVDIVSTSLGYIDWYQYSQLDGKTAVTTRAARTLARKGVLLVTAMGNEGNYVAFTNSTGTLIAPADADSIISVGATLPSKRLTSFSSTGPSFDGRTKPEVVAQGSSIVAPNGTTPSGYNLSWGGTSFATPLTAAAATLILSTHPEATPMQIRAALMQTADTISDGTSKSASYPNVFYGWGQVNAYRAALSLGPVVSNMPIVRYTTDGGSPALTVSIWVAASGTLDLPALALYYKRRSESSFTRLALTATTTSGLYQAAVPVTGATDTSFVGYVTVGTVGGSMIRRPTSTGTFDLRPTSDSLTAIFPPTGVGGVPVSYELLNSYPNPFNAGTTIAFRAPSKEPVDVAIYSLLGERVRTIFTGMSRIGDNLLPWTDARGDNGMILASGIYFVRLSTPQGVWGEKLMLLK